MEIAQIDFTKLFQEQTKNFEKGSVTLGTNLKLGDIVSALLPYLFAGAGLLLLLFLLYGGISLMTSGGDPKAIQSAKDKITGALVGFVIVFAAYWIVQVVGRILGVQVFGNIFK